MGGGHPAGWAALARWGSDRLPVVLPQGDYDQSKTKVLHLSQNPAGAARQRLREDQQQLQEECARLRELVRALEAGGPVPAHQVGPGPSIHPSVQPTQEPGHGPLGSGGPGLQSERSKDPRGHLSNPGTS